MSIRQTDHTAPDERWAETAFGAIIGCMPLSLQAALAARSPATCCARSTGPERRLPPRRWRSRASNTRGSTSSRTCSASSGWEKRRRRGCTPAGRGNVDAQIATLNAYLFEELGFTGNREHYDDPRNSFLNEVLDRRTGIPDQPRGGLSRGRTTCRSAARRRELPRPLPRARDRRSRASRI